MTKSNFIFACLCCFVFSAGCSNAQQEGKVIAEVNGNKLTYEFLLDQFPQEYRSSITNVQLTNAIETWIETELLYQEALKHNIDKDRLVNSLIEQKRKEIIAIHFVENTVSVEKNISDEEVNSIYQIQKDRFSINEELFRLSHIVLASKNAAEAVYTRLQKGDDFAALAIDYSEDEETRQKGGDIGLLPLSAFEKDMAETIDQTAIGEFTPPIKSQSGYYHIFILKDKKAAGEILPLEEIREDIIQTIVAEKRQEKYGNLLDSLKASANIKRYPLDDDK